MKEHWLARSGTLRLLWALFLVVLVTCVIAGQFVSHQGHFFLDGTFAFNAWYGFIACIVMVLIAKLLGRLLYRKDDYYDRD